MLKFLSVLFSFTLAIASQAAPATLSFTPVIRADGSQVTNVYGTNINISFGSAGVTNGDGSITVTAGSGSGSVTSVALTGPAGSTVAGSPITGSGTLALTFPSLVVTQNFNQPLVVSNNVGIDAAHWLSLSNFTAGRPLFLNSDNTVTQWIIGSGLTLSGNTISATGGGSVTSVAVTGPAGVTSSGGPITTSGTITLSTPGLLLTNGESVASVFSNTLSVDAASIFFSSNQVVVPKSIAANTFGIGLALSNTLTATTANQSYSPGILFAGQSFSGAAKVEQFRLYQIPLQGAGSFMRFDSATNSSATFGKAIDFDLNGTQTNSGDIWLGTSGGTHAMSLIGPHAGSGWTIGSDSPSTMSGAVNCSTFAVQINAATRWTFSGNTPFNITPAGDNTQSIGQGGGATARLKNVVMGGSVTNDINGAGSGASIDIAAGGGLTSNGNGSDMNIVASQANGTGRSGAIIVRTAPTLQGSGSTQNALVIRSYLSSKRVNLTETTATIVFNVSLASGKWCSLHVFASTQADDGTDRQVDSDEFLVSAVNKAGTVTTGISTIGVATSSSVATGASTLTTAWTAVANGNGVDIKNNATSSLVQTTLASYWRVEIDTDDTTLAITPQ